MNLPGRLRLTTLGDVLGAVYREGATGVLELTDAGGCVHRVHFAGGLVAHVDSPIPRARLGDVLRDSGLVDAPTLRRLGQRLQAEPGRRSGDLLVEMGVVAPRHIELGLRLQRRERLERLFLLGDARLAFRVARPHDAEAAPLLEPNEFLLGRPRGRDKTGNDAVAPGRRRDPVRSRALATLGLGDAADRSSVQRAFRQLAGRLHPDRFPTAEASDREDLMRRFVEISAAYHVLVG